MSLQNKIAIITGGAQGTGYAIAEHFARKRAKVIIADIDKVIGKKAARKLQKISSATYVHCDVSQKLDVHNLVATALDIHGHIDILINNAAVINTGDFLSIKEEDFERVLNVNLKGSFLCGQAVAKQMIVAIKKGHEPGTIINISAVNAVFAIANQIPATISKNNLNPLTKVMALSLAEHGIRVNAIGPGSTMSKILRAAAKNQTQQNTNKTQDQTNQIIDVAKIAEVAEFLASSEAAQITGQTICADSLAAK